MNRQQLRKWPTRRRQRALTVTVEESGEPLDIGAFCERSGLAGFCSELSTSRLTTSGE